MSEDNLTLKSSNLSYYSLFLLSFFKGVSDEKLLASYVRDVWDRFDGCSKELLSRHRMEEETLWLNQAHQWREKLKSEFFCQTYHNKCT